jgi:hypothetical protein
MTGPSSFHSPRPIDRPPVCRRGHCANMGAPSDHEGLDGLCEDHQTEAVETARRAIAHAYRTGMGTGKGLVAP